MTARRLKVGQVSEHMHVCIANYQSTIAQSTNVKNELDEEVEPSMTSTEPESMKKGKVMPQPVGKMLKNYIIVIGRHVELGEGISHGSKNEQSGMFHPSMHHQDNVLMTDILLACYR